MSFWALKLFSINLSPVEQIARELEKIRIELDPQLHVAYGNNGQIRQSLEQLTATPEFEILTQDLHYDHPQFQASKLNFNLINAIHHDQDAYVPTLRLIANAPWRKYFLTANDLNNIPSYHLNPQLLLEAPLFVHLGHRRNPLFKNMIKTFVLLDGIGGYVKMGFRNNLRAKDPAERFVEFSTPHFFSYTYTQGSRAVLEDTYGICMRTKSQHMVKVLFRPIKEKNVTKLQLEAVYDRHRTYDRRYFFKGFKLINTIVDYLDWAMKFAIQTRKNPLVQERISQGLIRNDELVPVGR